MKFLLTTSLLFFTIGMAPLIRSMEMTKSDYKKPLLEDHRLEVALLQEELLTQVPILDNKFVQDAYMVLNREGRKAISNLLSSQPELRSFIMQDKPSRKNRHLEEVLSHVNIDKDFVDVISALHSFRSNILLSPRYAPVWREIMEYLPTNDRNIKAFKDYLIRHITPGPLTAKKVIKNFNGYLLRVPEDKMLQGIQKFYKAVKYSTDDNILRRPYKDFSSLQNAIWACDSKAFKAGLEEYLKNFKFTKSLYTAAEVTPKRLLYMAAIEMLNCLKCNAENSMQPYLRGQMAWYIVWWEVLKELSHKNKGDLAYYGFYIPNLIGWIIISFTVASFIEKDMQRKLQYYVIASAASLFTLSLLRNIKYGTSLTKASSDFTRVKEIYVMLDNLIKNFELKIKLIQPVKAITE